MQSSDFGSVVTPRGGVGKNPRLRMAKLHPPTAKLFQKYADGGPVEDTAGHDFMQDITEPVIKATSGAVEGLWSQIKSIPHLAEALWNMPDLDKAKIPWRELADYARTQGERAVSSPEQFGQVVGENMGLPGLGVASRFAPRALSGLNRLSEEVGPLWGPSGSISAGNQAGAIGSNVGRAPMAGMGYTLDKIIEQAKMGKMPGTQWANYLKPGRTGMFGNFPAGLTADELRFAGEPFHELLKNPESVTREDLQAALNNRARARVSVGQEAPTSGSGVPLISRFSGVKDFGGPKYAYTGKTPGMQNYAELKTSFEGIPPPERSHFGDAISWTRTGTFPLEDQPGFTHRMDEVQSDIHHLGSDKGYYDPSDPKYRRDIEHDVNTIISKHFPNIDDPELKDLVLRYRTSLVPGRLANDAASRMMQNVDFSAPGGISGRTHIIDQLLHPQVDYSSTGPVRRAPLANDAWIEHEMRKNLLAAAQRGASSMSMVTPDIMKNRYRQSPGLENMYANIMQPKFLSLAKKYGLDVKELPQPLGAGKDPLMEGVHVTPTLEGDEQYYTIKGNLNNIRAVKRDLNNRLTPLNITPAQLRSHFGFGNGEAARDHPPMYGNRANNNLAQAHFTVNGINHSVFHGMDQDLFEPHYSAIKDAYDAHLQSYRERVQSPNNFPEFQTLNQSIHNQVSPHYQALLEKLPGIEDALKIQLKERKRTWQLEQAARQQEPQGGGIASRYARIARDLRAGQPHIMLPHDARQMIIQSGVPVYKEGGAVTSASP